MLEVMTEPREVDFTASARVGEWIRSEKVLWPWVARFLWSPAQDLHPSRRDELMPGWPEALWSNAEAVAHISNHLLASQAASDCVPASQDAQKYPIALMPQPLLARLARRVGLVLHGAEACAALITLDDDEKTLLNQRMPLYWHAPPVRGTEPESTGWYVLRMSVSDAPQSVRQRFEWKTPLEPGTPGAPLPDQALLAGLIQKLLREFDTPWASSFATLRRPDRQIRLRG